MERREVFGPCLPDGVAVLTAGVDIQDDRIELEVVGWGGDEESWSIAYEVIYGDPATPLVWNDLDQMLTRTFPHSRAVPDLAIRAAAVDTGGHHTMAAYAFCRERFSRRVWAIKGRGGSAHPIWPRRPSRNNKGRVHLFSLGVDTAKDAIYARLRITEPGPGCCHFPMDRDAEWFRQLTSEKVVTRYKSGHPVRQWVKKDHDRNEALDCRVYALSALHGLMSMGLKLNREADRIALAPLRQPEEGGSSSASRLVAPPAQPVRRNAWLGERRSFLR